MDNFEHLLEGARPWAPCLMQRRASASSPRAGSSTSPGSRSFQSLHRLPDVGDVGDSGPRPAGGRPPVRRAGDSGTSGLPADPGERGRDRPDHDPLDGLPLAIELAAGRAKLLDPDEIRKPARCQARPAGRGASDLPPRQRTLRAAIEWSYDLLEPDAQRLFARLAAFSGGWTLDAAEAVCAPGLNSSVLDGLGRSSTTA